MVSSKLDCVCFHSFGHLEIFLSPYSYYYFSIIYCFKIQLHSLEILW